MGLNDGVGVPLDDAVEVAARGEAHDEARLVRVRGRVRVRVLE